MAQQLSRIHLQIKGWRSCFLGILIFLVAIGCSRQSPVTQDSVPATPCHIVQHSMGESCVPFNPQRVIVLSGLDSVLALGVNPVGTLESFDPLFVPYLNQDQTKPPEMIGWIGSRPSLEAILKLEPDLILGTSWDIDANTCQRLSQIAPTIAVKLEADGQWKEPLSKFAEALGKTPEAEKILADYNDRLAEFKVKMGDRLNHMKASLVRVYPDALAFYFKTSFPGSILNDAGLQRPPAQDVERSGNQQRVDRELITILDADVMFVWIYGYTEEIAQHAQTALEKLKTDPLWLTLNVVQRNQVYEVPSSYWFGFGPIAANLVLDDLFKYLIETPQT
jgi:iron complex transport system substrate-binding protein